MERILVWGGDKCVCATTPAASYYLRDSKLLQGLPILQANSKRTSDGCENQYWGHNYYKYYNFSLFSREMSSDLDISADREIGNRKF